MIDVNLKHMFEKLLYTPKKELFYKQMVLYAENKMLACHNVDKELMDFHDSAIKEARATKENSDVWFTLAKILREIAHKVHFKYENPIQDNRFLKIIK